jgi:hypothetical protein
LIAFRHPIQITEKKLPKKHNFVEGWVFLPLRVFARRNDEAIQT